MMAENDGPHPKDHEGGLNPSLKKKGAALTPNPSNILRAVKDCATGDGFPRDLRLAL
jgi:hypothetical protein